MPAYEGDAEHGASEWGIQTLHSGSEAVTSERLYGMGDVMVGWLGDGIPAGDPAARQGLVAGVLAPLAAVLAASLAATVPAEPMLAPIPVALVLMGSLLALGSIGAPLGYRLRLTATGPVMICGALLLPPNALGLLVLPGMMRRARWADRAVNAAAHYVAMVAAAVTYWLVQGSAGQQLFPLSAGRFVAASVCAVVMYWIVEEGCYAGVLVARLRCSLSETGLFQRSLTRRSLTELLMGSAMAALALTSPWLATVAIPLIGVHVYEIAAVADLAQSRRDPSTGLTNQRAFDADAERLFASAARRDAPVSLIVADVDRLKRLNDEHGTDAGNVALQTLADVMRARTRPSDVLARVGAQLWMLTSGRESEEVREVAEQVRDRLGPCVSGATGGAVECTTSLGVAVRQSGESLNRLKRRADMALWQAKMSGGNALVYRSPASEDETGLV